MKVLLILPMLAILLARPVLSCNSNKIHQLEVRITKVHVLCTMVYIRVGATLTDLDAQLTQDKRPRFFKISKKGFSKR